MNGIMPGDYLALQKRAWDAEEQLAQLRAELDKRISDYTRNYVEFDKEREALRSAIAAEQARVEKLAGAIESKCNLFLEQSEEIAREHFVNDEWDNDESFGKFTTLLDCRSALISALDAAKE